MKFQYIAFAFVAVLGLAACEKKPLADQPDTSIGDAADQSLNEHMQGMTDQAGDMAEDAGDVAEDMAEGASDMAEGAVDKIKDATN